MIQDLKRDWYRMHDVDNRGAIHIDARDRAELLNQAADWNRKGYGIFWTANEFSGPRQIANLTRINSWPVDMDDGSKEDMAAKLHRSPLVPSFVVETKRGYQAYWNAKDAKPEHWNAIVLDRLVPFFGSDKNARDLARILRVPGYLHLKDPTKPFMVRVVHALNVSYSETQIAQAFPDANKAAREEKARRDARRECKPVAIGDSFWDNVWALDCEEGLSRLSGHPAVGGEHYTFKRVANGNLNILVDGKGTSCWIDRNRRIGSLSEGGPGLYQWLRWFKNSPGECARVLKQIFPQLERHR